MFYHYSLNCVCKLISSNCIKHVITVCVHACVHCWYFTCFKAYEVVWLSAKPHLNRTIADSSAPVMRLFVRALFLWMGCSIFLWINQLGSICIHSFHAGLQTNNWSGVIHTVNVASCKTQPSVTVFTYSSDAMWNDVDMSCCALNKRWLHSN